MDPFTALLLLALAAAPLAVVSGWFVRHGDGGLLGSVTSGGGRDAWWRASMPWPTGVQEEDGPSWRLGFRDSTLDGIGGAGSSGHAASADSPDAAGEDGSDAALLVAPVRARPRLVTLVGRRVDGSRGR